MVGSLRDALGMISSVKGDCVSPQMGATYELIGRWDTHPRYGRGFAFETYSVELPVEEDAVVTYLQATADWIGLSIAGAMVNEFGAENVMHVLKMDPERVAESIRGITIERAKTIQSQLIENERLELVTIQLNGLIAGAGLGPATIKKALLEWGHQAYDVVRTDPFQLTRLRGIGFPLADRVRAKLGIAPEDPYRLRSGILYVINEACRQNGHTFLRSWDFRAQAIEILTVPIPVIESMLPELVDEKLIVVDRVEGADDGAYEIALHAMRQAEIDIARKLSLMDGFQSKSAIVVPPTVDLTGLAEDQADALTRLIVSKVFILTGGPGTGKAQPLYSKVLTPTGWTTMGAIRVGDAVMNSSGTTSHVVGVFPRGVMSIYRVTFSDGSSADCTIDHLWSTSMRDHRKRKRKPL